MEMVMGLGPLLRGRLARGEGCLDVFSLRTDISLRPVCLTALSLHAISLGMALGCGSCSTALSLLPRQGAVRLMGTQGNLET